MDASNITYDCLDKLKAVFPFIPSRQTMSVARSMADVVARVVFGEMHSSEGESHHGGIMYFSYLNLRC